MSENFDITLKSNSENIMDWGSIAKCKGQPADWWYVESYQTNEGRLFTKQAKMVCGVCPVRRQCLDYALQNHEEHGVWGGLTPKERGVGRLARIARYKESLR